MIFKFKKKNKEKIGKKFWRSSTLIVFDLKLD